MRDKFDVRALPGVFIGYPSTQKGYKIYLLESRKVVINRNVTFRETEFPFEEKGQGEVETGATLPISPSIHLNNGEENILEPEAFETDSHESYSNNEEYQEDIRDMGNEDEVTPQKFVRRWKGKDSLQNGTKILECPGQVILHPRTR